MIALATPDTMLDTVICGDALTTLRAMETNSVDAIVTDPPAGISFMGKEWDNFTMAKPGQNNGGFFNHSGNGRLGGEVSKYNRDTFIAFLSAVMREALRVLKPGGHALVWALPRTSHWTALALEDAGFEVRDCVYHIFGSGFPKSTAIDKQIDKMAPRQGMFTAFAKHFQERRQASGLSQKQIAQYFPSKTGGMTGCVWNWENGANVPTLEQWHILQDLLGLSDEWLPLIERIEAEREVIGKNEHGYKAHYGNNEAKSRVIDITAPATPEAEQWDGWGSALKPAVENWWLCRKPITEPSIAANVLKWNCGALNIDACRVAHNGRRSPNGADGKIHRTTQNVYGQATSGETFDITQGRFPSHLLLSHSLWCVPTGTKRVRGTAPGGRPSREQPRAKPDMFGLTNNPSLITYTDPDGYEQVEDWDCHESCPILQLDRQSGIRPTSGRHGESGNGQKTGLFGMGSIRQQTYFDQGGASRYFQQFPPDVPFTYQPKASRAERNLGCEGLPEQTAGVLDHRPSGDFHTRLGDGPTKPASNVHPTVKPLSLMRWLIRLVTPPGGIVLDCFAGSGSTCVAAIQEGMHFIGIEQSEEYCTIARSRIAHAWQEVTW